MKADLHLHTTASDGTLTPQELVHLAAKEGFDLIAVTDHDCVDGFDAAYAEGKKLGVRVIPGVELSCGSGKEVHILGYGFDPGDKALHDFCRERREQRIERAKKMCGQLAAIGRPVSFDRVLSQARGVVGRPHVARELLRCGYVLSVKDAFERYLTPGKAGFVPREKVKTGDAIALICAAGGAAVLAHPLEMKMGETALEALIGEWKARGLAGLEVYHPSAANNHAASLERLARREGLLVTGGSDYHGPTARDLSLGEGLERWTTAQEDIKKLLARTAFTA